MHIAEGVLSAPVLIAGAAVAAAGIAAGLRSLDAGRMMTAALAGAAFFAASLIHLPLGPASVHLILNGLLGVLLGWAAVPVIFTGLLLQAVLYGYGGLTVLGVNTATMGAGAAAAWYAALAVLSCCSGLGARKALAFAGFAGGAAGVLTAGVLTAAALAGTDEGFRSAASVLLAAHLPVMLIEGAVTAAALVFISRVRPALLPEALRKRIPAGK